MAEKIRFKLPVAVFMILREGDKMLLIQRAQTGWRDGYWSLPAGSLEDGEDLVTAAIRETEEEVGVSIAYEDVRLFHTQHCRVEGQNWINIYFETSHWKGTPRVCEPHKHSQVAWQTVSELPEPMVEYVQETLVSQKTPLAFGWL